MCNVLVCYLLKTCSCTDIEDLALSFEQINILIQRKSVGIMIEGQDSLRCKVFHEAPLVFKGFSLSCLQGENMQNLFHNFTGCVIFKVIVEMLC